MDEEEIQANFDKLARHGGTELAFNLVVSTILEQVCEHLAFNSDERFKGMAVALNKIREGLIAETV